MQKFLILFTFICAFSLGCLFSPLKSARLMIEDNNITVFTENCLTNWSKEYWLATNVTIYSEFSLLLCLSTLVLCMMLCGKYD